MSPVQVEGFPSDNRLRLVLEYVKLVIIRVVYSKFNKKIIFNAYKTSQLDS